MCTFIFLQADKNGGIYSTKRKKRQLQSGDNNYRENPVYITKPFLLLYKNVLV
jgi:hypothetical protein